LKLLIGNFILMKPFLEAQQNTMKRIDSIVEKTIFFDRYSNQLNKYLNKVILRLY